MTLAPTHEDMARKWQQSHAAFRFKTPVITIENPGHDLFYSLVFGRYEKSFDMYENYTECKQFRIYDKVILMDMEICNPTESWFELRMRDSEAVIFVYHVSDRQKFLELPSAVERACNAITPQPVIPQPERDVGLLRRILSRLHLRHSEAQPPPPLMVLAVSDMDPKSTRLRQVTSEEGDSFSRSIGAIFLELSCARYTVIASPQVKEEAMIELSKRVILNRVYAEKVAKDGKVVK